MKIIGHMVVGPGEADRYLLQVTDRMYLWADEIHVALDADAGDAEIDLVKSVADAWQQLPLRWVEHEGRFRQAAWESMVEALRPTDEDFILVIDADEVVHDYDMVRAAAKSYPGGRVGFTFYEMWSPTHYRIDRLWKPYPAWVMFPFRHGGRFVDRRLACGREPTYARLASKGPIVSEILHYGYAREEDRIAKHQRYLDLDGGLFHNPEHLRSILYPPSLMEWKKGGLLDV